MLSSQIHNVLQHACRLLGEGPDQATDAELLRRFVATREAAAFDKLLGRHGAMVLHVCRRLLPGAEDAEDVFQATFLLLARKADSIRHPASVGAWLHGVALRLARQARAAAARRRTHEGRASPRTAADPLDELSVREARAVLDEELLRLPEKYRAPLVLCYLEGKSRDEAARELGWSVSLVKNRLEQARDLLRLRLKRRGLSLSTALVATLLSGEPALAALPANLARSTTRAALVGTIPARVAPLVEGGLKALAGPPRVMGALLLMASLVLGVSLLTYQVPAEPLPRKVERPREQPKVPTDRFGDPLPPGALARLGTVRFRPGLPVGHVAFSSGGTRIVTATLNMEVNDNPVSLCLWDRATGKRLRQFGVRKMPYLAMALAPDDKTLATQDQQGPIRLWDITTGKELRQITRGSVVYFRGETGDEAEIRGVGLVFSPDGKALAARGPDRSIRLWETATGKEVCKLTADSEDASPLAFSRDGKTLATSADKMVRLWDVATGKGIARLEKQKGLPGASAFSRDGKTFTTLARRPGQLYQVTAYVWDLASGQVRRKWDLPPTYVFASCLSPDGTKALIGGYSGGKRLYDLSTGKELSQLTTPFSGDRFSFFAASFSPDGQTIAAGGENRVLQLWDAKTGKPLPSPGHQGVIQSLSLSAGGEYLASVAFDEGIRLWDVTSGRPVAEFRSPTGQFSGVAFLPDGKMLVAVGEAPFVRLLEIPTGREVRRFAGAREGHDVVALSPDGKIVAAGSPVRYRHTNTSDKSIRLWETATGKLLREMAPPRAAREDGGVTCLAFSPDGRLLASGGWGKTVCVWDVATGQRWSELPGHKHSIASLCFSPDGKTLAVAHWDNTIRLWEVLSGKERGRLAGHSHRVTQVVFAPDGRLVSASHDSTIRVWDLRATEEVGRFVGHEAVVGPLALSADGKTLFSGGWDTTILAWDLQGLPRPKRAKPVELSPQEREAQERQRPE
jgi:RNA polymerase sigma factor (sigma-70 family)